MARPVSKDRELSYGSGLVSSSYHPRSTEGRGLDGIIEYRKLVPAVVPPFMNPTNKIHEIRSAPYSHLSHLIPRLTLRAYAFALASLTYYSPSLVRWARVNRTGDRREPTERPTNRTRGKAEGRHDRFQHEKQPFRFGHPSRGSSASLRSGGSTR